jgi:hypothetical protein
MTIDGNIVATEGPRHCSSPQQCSSPVDHCFHYGCPHCALVGYDPPPYVPTPVYRAPLPIDGDEGAGSVGGDDVFEGEEGVADMEEKEEGKLWRFKIQSMG